MLRGHLVLGVRIDFWASLSRLGKSKTHEMIKQNDFFNLHRRAVTKTCFFQVFSKFFSTFQVRRVLHFSILVWWPLLISFHISRWSGNLDHLCVFARIPCMQGQCGRGRRSVHHRSGRSARHEGTLRSSWCDKWIEVRLLRDSRFRAIGPATPLNPKGAGA